jgi:outer membrane protein insertion porin family/translocation and assembly module TamA
VTKSFSAKSGGAWRTVVLRALFAFCFATLLMGCKDLPPGKDAISAVDIEGSPSQYDDEIEAGLSTRKSPRLFGIFWGVYEYETLDREELAQDLARIERHLRRRGYYDAKVMAARVVRTGEQKVEVEIRVDPGEPVTIRSVSTTGLAHLPFDAATKSAQALTLRRGQLFDEDAMDQAKTDLQRALADQGFAFADVEAKARVDLTKHAADVEVQIKAGKRSTFGPIVIEGLKDLPEGPVRETLRIKEGERYSFSELDIARSALFQLRAFSRIEIVPDLSKPESAVVPITVRLAESALRTIKLGGGVRLDVLRFAASGRASWEHRNFLGGLRNFTATLRPGLTFFPTRIDYLHLPTRILPENSLSFRLQQPAFLESRTTGFINSAYNIFPLLYPLTEGADPKRARIIGYNELSESVGLTRIFWGRRVPLEVSYNWQANFPFAYQGGLLPGLGTVIVSYPELVTTLDLRDNPISTKSGVYLTNSFQVGNPLLGGMVSDIRVSPEARFFVPVDYAKRVVLAARVTLGFLFPSNYGETLEPNNPEFISLLNEPTNPAVVQDQQKLLFRAFYSGGPDSNRGYPYRRVGPQGPIGFLQPTGEDCSVFTPQGTRRTLPPGCILPLGGFSLWEASLELRFTLADPWGVVLFVDTSNVSNQVAYLDFEAPHVSVGPGLRYGSPIGPVRLDLGFRVPGLQIFETDPDTLDVAQLPQYADDSWYNSFNLNILIGEAF